MAGDRLQQFEKAGCFETAVYLRRKLTQFQRIARVGIYAGADLDLGNTGLICLTKDPGLEICLRETVGLCLPKPRFRLNSRQVGSDPVLVPNIGVAQMLDEPELILLLCKRSPQFGVDPVENREATRRKCEGKRDEQKPRTKGREVVPEPFAKPRRNSADAR